MTSPFRGIPTPSEPVVGTSGDDSIASAAAVDVSQGGNDTVISNALDGFINFGASLTGDDSVFGGRILLDGDYSAGAVINAQQSSVTLGSSHSYRLIAGLNSTISSVSAVNLDPGQTLYFDGSAIHPTNSLNISGSAGNDTLMGPPQAENVTLSGGAGDDLIDGNGVIYGGLGNDTIHTVHANAIGGTGNDLLVATGTSYLRAEEGDDTLVGGGGNIEFDGGSGTDSFVVTSLATGAQLVLQDLEFDETIDFHAIPNLKFIGTNAFSGAAGEFKYVWGTSGSNHPNTTIQFDLNGDRVADASFEIRTGEQTLQETAPGSNILRSTPDITAPQLTTIYPRDNGFLISIHSGLNLGFNEVVRAGTGTIELHKSDGTLVRTLDAHASVITNSFWTAFVDFGVLDVDTSYYVIISPGAIEDLAGNPFAGITSSNSLNFSTALRPEVYFSDAPHQIPHDFTPTNVPADQDLVYKYTGPVTLADFGNIEIVRNYTELLETIPVTDQSRVTVAGDTIIINPNIDLPFGESIIVRGGNGTLRGNGGEFSSFPSDTIKIETAANPNATHPLLLTTTPGDDAANISAGASLTFTFDRPVTFGAGQFQFRRSDGVLVQAIGVADSSQVTYSGNTVTVHPTVPLAPGVTYSVTLAAGAIRDLNSNSFAGITSPTAFNFTVPGTADTAGPALASASPADNSGSVPMGADIVLTFNEAVQRGTGNILIQRSDGTIFKDIPLYDFYQIKFSGSTVTIDPSLDFSLASGYSVIVPQTAIWDYAGNSFAGLTTPASLNFTTASVADTTAPLLRNSTPADNASQVRADANIGLEFNETVKAGSGNIVIHRSSDDGIVESIDVTNTGRVAITGALVTVNPSNNFDFGTGYYLTVDTGAIADMAGNGFAGISGPATLNFTTVPPPDLTPPVLIGSPLDNATGVTDRFTHFVLTFNEPVKAGSGSFVVHKALDDSVVQNLSVDNARFSGNTVSVEITSLQPNTTYYVTVAPSVVTDLAGNGFSGFSGKFDLDFTTAPPPDYEAPHLISARPATGDKIAPDGNMVFVFDEAVQAGPGSFILHNPVTGADTVISASDTNQVTFAGNSVILNPSADLLPNMHYALSVGDDAIADFAGHTWLVQGGSNHVDFKTATSSAGLQFNVLFDQPTSTLPAGFVSAVLAGTEAIKAVYDDAITINLHVGYGELRGNSFGDEAIAMATTDLLEYTYAEIRDALIADGLSANDVKSILTLPADDPSSNAVYLVPFAEAAALGLPDLPSQIDIYTGFSNIYDFDYDPSGGIDSGKFDFAAAFAHEVTHGMGRILGGGSGNVYTPLDLYSFTGPDQRPFDLATSRLYFSIDSGHSGLMPFNSNPDGDDSDWDISAGQDAFGAFAAPGAPYHVTENDFVLMDVLGYDRRPAPDTKAPSLLSTTPSDNEFQVPVTASLSLTFDEVVQPGTGDITVHAASDGSAVASFAVSGSHVSFQQSVVTVTLDGLAERTGYYVTMSPGAVTDSSGNAYAGIATPTAFSFTTADANPFVTSPHIAVFGANLAIANGDNTPSSTDNTDLGSYNSGSGGYVYANFVIRNDGAQALNLGPANIPAGFVVNDPLVSVLAPGASDQFTLLLDKTEAGVKSGQVSFTTNDPDSSTFGFFISATVIAVPPEIVVQGDGTNIADGSSTVRVLDLTDFGTAVQGDAAIQHTFRVYNDGGLPLNLGTLTVPSGFSVVEGLSSTIAANGVDAFTIRLNTATAGNYSGDISFTTNDSDENPFNFRISGVVNAVLPIELYGSTALNLAGSRFLMKDGTAPGVSVKYLGADATTGQFGAWTPIAAEKTGNGYEIVWKFGSADQYTVWGADAGGNYTGNIIGAVPGTNAALQAAETLFQQDINNDGHIGLQRLVIESAGATALAAVASEFALQDGNGNGPVLKYQGANVIVGQFGAWTPIGAEKTTGGYAVAWKAGNADQYTVWNTDVNGNYVGNLIGAVSGSDTGLQSAETLFQQDLNGNGTTGLSGNAQTPVATIEDHGATTLGTAGNLFYFLDGGGAGPVLKFGGSNFIAGQFGAWTPIGAEKIVSGYEVAWKFGSDDQFTVWNTDANGNYIGNVVGAVAGANAAIQSAETLFQQDLNGDGAIGPPAMVNLETNGAIKLALAHNEFFLQDSNGAGPALRFNGSNFIAGQFGAWTPVGAEKTANGYEVAWKFGSDNQYTVWNTDLNGNYTGNVVGAVPGSNPAILSAETVLQQDLNGDGQIGGAQQAIESSGATRLMTSANQFYFQDGAGHGPALAFNGSNFIANQFGAWTPIGVEATAGGYEVAWKFGSDNQYTLWNADANGNYTGNIVGAVSGSDAAIISAESLFQQDLNGDGQIGAGGLGTGIHATSTSGNVTITVTTDVVHTDDWLI